MEHSWSNADEGALVCTTCGMIQQPGQTISTMCTAYVVAADPPCQG